MIYCRTLGMALLKKEELTVEKAEEIVCQLETMSRILQGEGMQMKVSVVRKLLAITWNTTPGKVVIPRKRVIKKKSNATTAIKWVTMP